MVRSSCDDYRASADEESIEHQVNRKGGKKMDCDVLISYSSDILASRGNIKVWKERIGGGKLEIKSLGNGVEHFLAEEVPEKTAQAMVAFYSRPNL